VQHHFVDLTARCCSIANPEALHEYAFAIGHWRADTHTQDMGHISKEIGRSPPPDKHIAFDGKLKNFLGGISRHARPIDTQTLEQGSFTSKKALHFALAHACALRYVLCDEFMVHNVQPQPFGEASRDVLAECRHLTGHCDDRHDALSEGEGPLSIQAPSECSRAMVGY
jgi:hypothetical protein